MDPDFHARAARSGVAGGLRDRQQLDPVAEIARVRDVLRGHARDALGVDVLEVDERAERERDQDLELVGRVEAFDVERGIGLGVSLRLGVLEDHREVEALVGHLGQDVVRRPVHDAEHRQDPVRDQPFLDRADQRDAAGHRRLERERHAAPARLVVELGAVVGEQRLVGGDHVLAGGERLQDEGPRRLEPADQLDHDMDRRIVENPRGVRRHRQPGQVEAFAAAGDVDVGDRAELQPAAGALLEGGALRVEELHDAGADRAEAEQSDPDFVHERPGISG